MKERRMSAEELFVEAGWEKQEGRLAYWKHRKFIDGEEKDYCISFVQIVAEVHLYCIDSKENASPLDLISSVDMKTLIAILQQCVELEWLLPKEDTK